MSFDVCAFAFAVVLRLVMRGDECGLCRSLRVNAILLLKACNEDVATLKSLASYKTQSFSFI